MYTIEKREEKLNEIIIYFKAFSETDAILLLGSGVSGFKDLYSDIDVSIVVSNIEDAKKLFACFKEELKKENPFILGDLYFEESHYLVICITDELLEINVSIVNKQVFSLKNTVKLMYKKDSFDMKELKIRDKYEITSIPEFVKDQDLIEHSFYFMQHVLFFVYRKDYMNASDYLDKVRELIKDLYSLKICGEKVEKAMLSLFDDEFISRYQKTFTSEFTLVEFRKIINATYDLLFYIIDDENICFEEDYKRYQNMYQKIKNDFSI